MEPILQVKGLTHTYSAGTPFQRSAIQDISFNVQPGEFLGIIGHTGSGKSTLIQHLNGLLKPTSGQVLLAGRDIWADPKHIRKVRFRVGLVFQYPEYQLFEETVYKDIAFGPRNMGKSGAELDRCVREAARLAGVRDEHLDKSPFDLSGGQKRRVALAGVLAMDPEVLVLDEPTAGLDPAGRENLMENIRTYHRNKARTILLVSHSMEEIARNADRILVLKDAHILMSGTPSEVFARAEELLSAGLDVPQVTRVAMALKARGLPVDTAVYTVEALERQLLELRRKSGRQDGGREQNGGKRRPEQQTERPERDRTENRADRTEGENRAEGHHPGAVLPRRHHRPPAGPPDENPPGGLLHCGPVQRGKLPHLRHYGGVPDSV